MPEDDGVEPMLRGRGMSPPSPPAKRKEHWLTTLCTLVIVAGVAWLVMVIALTRAAFVVSWAGGDVVQWLIGAPAIAVLVGFVVGVSAELDFRRKRQGGEGKSG